MPFDFTKYHGAGNDFILLDDRREKFPEADQKLVQLLCDRHFGIGADGLILLRNPSSAVLQTEAEIPSTPDFAMLYFNADGREGSLCGNGGRCAVHFAGSLKLIKTAAGSRTLFWASDGLHDAEFLPDHRIALAMHPVKKWQELPDSAGGMAWVLDTGSPHYVSFQPDTSGLDVVASGRAIRYAEPFKALGINVNFAGPGSGSAADPLRMRTYERGVEQETLACGTGATAVALAYSLLKGTSGEQTIVLNAPGGLLEVHFTRQAAEFHSIRLTGPAVPVFQGTWFGQV
ncbi:MAG: diaminopimelate epimerase [Bacteroidetes bacterium]|nr:diaminopimelate epimerase [Bacteroidota bacterium]